MYKGAQAAQADLGAKVDFVFSGWDPNKMTSQLRDAVAAVSIGIIEGKILLDLAYEEDSRADVDMNFVMTGSRKFIEVQGTAESAPFTKNQMERMAEIAQGGIGELLKAQKKVLASIA